MDFLHLITPNSPGGTGKHDHPPFALCNRTVSKQSIAIDIVFATCTTCFQRAAVGYKYDTKLGKHIPMDNYEKASAKWDAIPNEDENGGRKRDVAIIRDVMGYEVTSEANGSYKFSETGMSKDQRPIPNCEGNHDFMMYVQSCTADELGAAKYIPILARTVGISVQSATSPLSHGDVALLLDASTDQMMKATWIAFQIHSKEDKES